MASAYLESSSEYLLPIRVRVRVRVRVYVHLESSSECLLRNIPIRRGYIGESTECCTAEATIVYASSSLKLGNCHKIAM